MRLRFALAGLVVLSASLAACSSGTACGFGCPPTASPTSTPGPLVLSGTETQNFTYYYGFPTVEPPSTITTGITQKVTVSPTSLASPFPPGTANDVHVDETDNLDGLQTINLTADAYTATSGNNVVLYGEVEDTPSSSNGQATIAQIVYAKPRVIDHTSDTNGATWSNKAGLQLSENFSDGHTENRTVANDGTYTEVGTAQAPDGSGYIPVNLIEKSTGAGTYSGPFLSNANVDFQFAAPNKLLPPTIVATYTISGTTNPFFTIPAWYTASPTFYAEKNTVHTGATPPAACNASGTFNDVRSTTTRLDTIIGYAEVTVSDSYGTSGSVACVTFNDALYNYYDWGGDTPAFITVSPNKKKISQVITTEVLSASGGSIASARHARGIRSAGGIPMVAIAGLQARFNAKIEATKRAMFDKKKGVR